MTAQTSLPVKHTAIQERFFIYKKFCINHQVDFPPP